MQTNYGAASPIADFFKRIVNFAGDASKPSGGSSTNSGKLPPQWEKANELSVEQSLGKPVGKKTPKRRVRSRRPAKRASIARKR